MDKKEQTRLRVQRYRDKHNSVTGPKDVTQEDVTQYPSILLAMVDPVKRGKLEKICRELKNHGVLRELRYGTEGPTFEAVSELLSLTG